MSRITFLDGPDPADPPAHYYVSCVEDGLARSWLLSGPYSTHEAAMAAVPAVRAMAEAQKPQAVWWLFGTAGSDVEVATPLGPEWQAGRAKPRRRIRGGVEYTA